MVSSRRCVTTGISPDGSTGDGTGTPNDGCEPLVGFTPGKIALVDRGLCEFGVKVLNAEHAGAKAVVIANTLGREIGSPMGPGVVGAQVTIPSVMIGQTNGTRLKTAMSQGAVNLTLQIVPVPNRDSDIDAGVIWINCWLLRDLRVPFGGMKESGVGREGGFESLNFFTEAKNVCVKI